MTLRTWNEYAADKWHAVVIGNGASIAINSCFSYPSLLEAAREAGLISKDLEQIFDYFKTSDFELVLRMLTQAARINEVLGIRNSAMSAAYKGIRNALVGAVRKVHVSQEQARQSLDPAARYLSQFDTVVSLSYDLFVYWVMLKWNSDINGHWFKDCFVNKNGAFEQEWAYLRKPYPPAQKTTLVFYPHGNLALASHVRGEERKITSTTKDTLVEEVFSKWASGDYSPLFVSEGTSEQKYVAIERSPYLKSVYDKVLPELGANVVIYGWAMAEQDDHLLRAILSGEALRSLAIAVMPTPESIAQSRAFEERIRRLAKNQDLAIGFFDATSKGCWIH